MRIPADPEPVCGDVEVDSDEEMGACASVFEDRVLGLLGRCVEQRRT